MDQLSQLVAGLISEAGDAPAIPRRLTGKLWFIFTQILTTPASAIQDHDLRLEYQLF
jgi:hypothetical protein